MIPIRQVVERGICIWFTETSWHFAISRWGRTSFLFLPPGLLSEKGKVGTPLGLWGWQNSLVPRQSWEAERASEGWREGRNHGVLSTCWACPSLHALLGCLSPSQPAHAQTQCTLSWRPSVPPNTHTHSLSHRDIRHVHTCTHTLQSKTSTHSQ